MRRRSFLLSASIAAGASASEPRDAIKAARHRIARSKALVSFYAKHLESGRELELRANDPVRSASTIKVPILIEAFAQAAAGKLSLDEKITLRDVDKFGGSGVLTEFSAGLAFPLRDLLHLMIVLSDNTATNLVIDRITADAVNERMASLGLTQTRLMRKILSSQPASGFSEEGRKPENQRFGLGRTCPREMAALLERLERGQIVDAASCRQMLDILLRQQYRDGILRRYPSVKMANKTGALDALRSDAALIDTGHGRVAMSISVDNLGPAYYSEDNEGLLLISDLSEILLHGLIPQWPAKAGV